MTNFASPAEGYAGDLFSGPETHVRPGAPRRPLELVSLADVSRPFPVDARRLWEALEIGKDFSDWIKYQIDRQNLLENIDFVPRFCSPILGSKTETRGGYNRIDYSLTIDAAKHIALMTNTPAGKAVRDHFIAVENAWNTPEMVMVRGLQAAQEVIRKQSEQIASLADDARVARTIAIAEGLKTVTEVAKMNCIGPRKFFEMLSARKILYRLRGNWVPHQEYIDLGYFVVKERTYGDEESAHLSSQTYVTGKGEVWLAKRMFPAQAGVRS